MSKTGTPTKKDGAIRQAPRGVKAGVARKPREKRWAEILGVAADVFYEKGYDASTLQDIADRVGILKGSIYYYINTKIDLLEQLLLEVHSEGLSMTRERAASPGSIFEKLAAMIRGHVEYMAENQTKTVVYLHEMHRFDPVRRDKLFGRHEFRNEYQWLIERGQQEGLVVANLDPKLSAQALLGCLNSIYQWYDPERDKQINYVAEHFVAIILRGIVSREAAETLEAMLA